MRIRDALKSMGPGVVMAATGIGASDFFSSIWAGSSVGSSILWSVVFGVVLKYYLTEGIARRQIVTGESFVHLWMSRGPRALRLFLAAYFALWAVCVFSMLMGATGLAASQLLPQLFGSPRASTASYGIAQGLGVLLVLAIPGYARFERMMHVLVGVAVLAVLYCLFSLGTPAFALEAPAFRTEHTVVVMAIVTGVGGTLTLLGYGAWIREKGYRTLDQIPLMRLDCAAGYGVTGLVMVSLILLAAGTLRARGIAVDSEADARAAFAVLGVLIRGFPLGRYVFALGFWAIVLSSMMGVWESVPRLFAEGWFAFRSEPLPDDVDRSRVYVVFRFVVVACACSLMFFQIPVLYLVYSVVSALFMPFLAANLLYWNNRRELASEARSHFGANAILSLGLMLFGYIGVQELRKLVERVM